VVHQPQSHGKDKGIANQNQNNNKPKQTITFKKKKKRKKKKKKEEEDEGCFVCRSPDHWTYKCPNRKEKNLNLSRRLNMVVSSSGGGISGYGNLPYVLSVFQFTTWWLDSGANVHVCSDASLFSSYQVAWDSSMMMGNGSHASIHGVGTVDLKLTSGKIVQLKNV
jgi:hypothetical protein